MAKKKAGWKYWAGITIGCIGIFIALNYSSVLLGFTSGILLGYLLTK